MITLPVDEEVEQDDLHEDNHGDCDTSPNHVHCDCYFDIKNKLVSYQKTCSRLRQKLKSLNDEIKIPRVYSYNIILVA